MCSIGPISSPMEHTGWFLVTFRPNWWIIGAIFEEICIYVEENEGFGQPLIPFILLIGELQMGPYMVTYWCVSECCSLIGSHRLYVYRNVWVGMGGGGRGVEGLSSGGSRISPRRGRQLPRGGANIRFCQIFPKTAWNWKNLGPGGGVPCAPLRSATVKYTQTVNKDPH